MSRRLKNIQRASDASPLTPDGPTWTAEMVTAALVGRKIVAVRREDETAIVLDFGKYGLLTISADLDTDHEQPRSDSDAEVLERLDVGAVAYIDLR
jgi:hypothetical protein